LKTFLTSLAAVLGLLSVGLIVKRWPTASVSKSGGGGVFSAPSVDPAAPTERYTNRLIHEKSPYLLQHAHNPVDWYPWGQEAFDKAKKENKPIFLSIGYSTCHWCHVMEKESFENLATAKFLNNHFVAIKVDREQRPDLDNVFMTFVVATTGSGGWPMTVWLTPDLKPIVGGTYFPSEEREGLPSLMSVLVQVSDDWRDHEPDLRQQASDITAKLQAFANQKTAPAVPLDAALLEKEFEKFASRFDAQEGGFGDAPKFPRPVILEFLAHFYARNGASSPQGGQALAMILFTLKKMAAGGIHDQLGGGFHRYATDGIWFVPHFEKMLYDQAQLAVAYTEAYQITHDVIYLSVARDILDYVKKDMTDPEGGFYSAEDADSLPTAASTERSEGAYYVWTNDQVNAVLNPADASLFDFIYGVEQGGNVSSDHGEDFQSKNILFQKHTLAEAAAQFHQSPDQIKQRLNQSRSQLLIARAKRPRPRKDDKIITAWNGLMISAFAKAYEAIGDKADLDAAKEAARFIEEHLYDPGSRTLLRAYDKGPMPTAGFADDYAFLIQGLLDLYDASLDTHWLAWALDLQSSQDRLFWDSTNGGYFNAAADDPNLLLRNKEVEDEAEPAANSIAALNLLRLGRLFDDKTKQQQAEKLLGAFSAQLTEAPGASPQMLVAAAYDLSPSQEVVIAGSADAADGKAMIRETQKLFAPYRTLVLVNGTDSKAFFAQHAPFYNSLPAKEGNATAYVCQNYVCQLPTTDLNTLVESLTR
jgi:uncharacterized protein YyaL (SSP411 family)